MLFTSGPNWTAVASSWPSGAVVKVLVCHAGGRGFESPLEQCLSFFFLLLFFFIVFLSSFVK